jgi:lipopolysaccharide assembly protein A
MQVVIILLLVLAILLVIFTLQNSIEISINVFFWEISNAPLVLVLICCIVIGYILAAIYFYPRIWKLKKEYKQMIKFNHELKELHDLNHPKTEEETDPEGIEMDKDEEKDKKDSFFDD